MGELSIEQSDDMTPWTEGPGLLVDAVLAGKLGNKSDRNELAKLGEDTDFRIGWFDLIHQADPKRDRPPAPLKKSGGLWDGCESNKYLNKT